jgi:multiple RNA-binding domain-containing protein 1
MENLTRRSRIIVKNIPSYMTQERFKTHFAAKGEVTDVRILTTSYDPVRIGRLIRSDGKSRQFGFVGYRSEQDAVEAVKYFNSSYIDTAKIQVAFARPVGDADIPRAWSKYSNTSSAFTKRNPDKADKKKPKADVVKSTTRVVPGDDDDAALMAFLDVMKPRSQKKTWANDDITGADTVGSTGVPMLVTKEADDDLYEDLPVVGASKNVSTKEENDEEMDAPQVDENPVETSTLLETPIAAVVEEESPTEMIAETGRLFIRNLAFGCTEKDLEALFGKFGPITEVCFID